MAPGLPDASDLAALADGRSNSLPALKALLADAEAKGRGDIRLPPGRFLIVPEPTARVGLLLPSGARLSGAGMDRTTLVMADGAKGHVINAPFGGVSLRDLTVDGNAIGRKGLAGHNIRVEGASVSIERVRSVNSVSYAIALGQRRFVRDAALHEIEIVNAGNDGIDIKNKLSRTEVVLDTITVRGFGRPPDTLDSALVGTHHDEMSGKAAVDLRGRCTVRNLTIHGVIHGRHGLRFRPGRRGSANGPGADAATASYVTVLGQAGSRQGAAISVNAHSVRLDHVDIRDVSIGLIVREDGLVVSEGGVTRTTKAAIYAKGTSEGRPSKMAFEDVAFDAPADIDLSDVDEALFQKCRFSGCSKPLMRQIMQDQRVRLEDSQFDRSCR